MLTLACSHCEKGLMDLSVCTKISCTWLSAVFSQRIYVFEHYRRVLCITVVMTLFVRATRLVIGTPRFSDPHGSKTPEPIDIKLDRSDYVGDITPTKS